MKALLDLQRLPYETTEVNPLTKGETKAWSGGYRKVPIALLEGEQVNDSAVICEGLLDKMGASGAMGAAELAAFRSPEALEWAKWSDEKFAVLSSPTSRAASARRTRAFGYVMEVPRLTVDKWSNQLVGAFAMWMAQGKIKKKYVIDDERAAVRAGLRHWLDEGVGTRPFAGGDRPISATSPSSAASRRSTAPPRTRSCWKSRRRARGTIGWRRRCGPGTRAC